MVSLAELAVLRNRMDAIGHKLGDPILRNMMYDAADAVYVVARAVEQSQPAIGLTVVDELTACSDCGCTVEDGECICGTALD